MDRDVEHDYYIECYLAIPIRSEVGYTERVDLWNKFKHVRCDMSLKLQFHVLFGLFWPLASAKSYVV